MREDCSLHLRRSDKILAFDMDFSLTGTVIGLNASGVTIDTAAILIR